MTSIGNSILLIDKNVSDLTEVALRHHIMEKAARIVRSGTSKNLRDNRDMNSWFLERMRGPGTKHNACKGVLSTRLEGNEC